MNININFPLQFKGMQKLRDYLEAPFKRIPIKSLLYNEINETL